MFYSNFQKTIALLVGVVAMALAISYFVFAWTEPTQAPPGGNVPAPLNVGSAGQSKAGGLILNTGGAATGLIVQYGNVGIGTTAPTQKLDVNGTIRLRGHLYDVNNSAGSYGQVLTRTASGPAWQVASALPTGTSGQTLRHDGTNWVANSVIYNNGGNVGIGTTGPAQKLDVQGGYINAGGPGGHDGGIMVNNACHWIGKGEWGFPGSPTGFGITISSCNSPVRILGANALGVYVAAGGNVGIGTTAPGEKLEVTGNIKITGSRIKNSAGYGIVQTNATDWLRINPDSNYPAIALYKPVAIGTGGLAVGEWSQQSSGILKVTKSAYLATAGGNVGIGTTGPTAKLDVRGPAYIEGNYLHVKSEGAGKLRVGAAWGIPGLYSSDGVTSDLVLGVPSGRKVYLGVSRGDAWVEGGTGKAYFKGNVGIGTTAPGAKLDVAGTVRMTGFQLGTSATAGHVLTANASGVGTWQEAAGGLPGGLPRGVIVMWSGELANIPDGWALCDGGTYTAPNGDRVTTPDLRDRFIYGVSAGENPGATGGASSYSLTTAQLPAHKHGISADGAHTHDVLTGPPSDAQDTVVARPVSTGYSEVEWRSGLTSGAGSHNHGGATGSTGSGASIDNRPSYYKLAFIMKL